MIFHCAISFWVIIYLTLSSNTPTAIPSAAPDPASPIKCSEPILLANKEAPT